VALLFGQFPTGQNPMDPNQSTPNGGFPDPKTAKSSATSTTKSGRAALDDSTKQIYGPNTMHYFLESDVLNSRIIQRRIDTSLHLFQRHLFQERSSFLTANLGNDGTAIRHIFVQSPTNLGTQLGYQAYMPMPLKQIRSDITIQNRPFQMWNTV